MQGGDISNSIPGRIIVTYDYVTYESPQPKKFLGVVVGTKEVRQVSTPTLSLLSRLTAKVDARLELAVFGATNQQADDLLADIDKRSWQPFNYATGYASPLALVSDLPYRPEVLGVIDIEDRMGAYGSYGISMDYLARAI